MKEIGGYIELDTYFLPMLHEGAIALNCGRNCLAYLFKSKNIRKLKVPYFICNSVLNICDREGVEKIFYHIGLDFKPTADISLADDEWLYLVNFYGQLNKDDIKEYVDQFGRVIVDQANDYFAKPIQGVDTFYTCRKWFGVADGAFLYTDKIMPENLPQDESYDRMRFLLGRFERTAAEFYSDYQSNNGIFVDQPIKRMSKLTKNLLHGIDYKAIEEVRRKNFLFLQEKLGTINRLSLKQSTFMYPFMVPNGAEVRKKLKDEKIYVPILWPAVFNITESESIEYKMAESILPLPIDQRYSIEDMKYIVMMINKLL